MPAAVQIAAAVVGGVATAAVSSALADDYGAENANAAQQQSLQDKTELDKKRYAFWEKYYQPIEKELSKESLAAGSQQQQDEAAAEVGSALTQSYDATDAELRRRLEASGGNPADPAYQSMLASQALAKGAQIGGAQYQARKGIRDEGFAKRFGVAQLGRDIPGSVSAGMATSSGLYGDIARQGAVLQRQQQQDIAYALRPIQQGVSTGVQNWWSSPGATANNPQTGNPWAVDAAPGPYQVIPMAAGGVVEQPTKALIGEEGDEAVLNEGALKLLGKKNVERLNRLGALIRKGVPREAMRSARPATSIRGVI